MQSQYKYFSRASKIDYKIYLEEQKSKYSIISDKEVCGQKRVVDGVLIYRY